VSGTENQSFLTPRGFRTALLSWLWLAISSVATGQTGSPLQFAPYVGPTTVNPGAWVEFSIVATNDGSAFDYQLLAAPANVSFRTERDCGRSSPYNGAFSAVLTWYTPPLAAVGTTNRFVVRAVDTSNPAISATGMVNIVVSEIPPIRFVQLSNGVPILQLDGLISDRSYTVEWTSALPATNWNFMVFLDRWTPRPAVVIVADSAPLTSQRFYRLSAGYDSYFLACP
jgi:hypothetical protein